MNAAQQLKQQGLQQGREEGREEGEYLKATTIAKKLIAQGRSIQYIQDLTNLPENEIINLVELEKAWPLKELEWEFMSYITSMERLGIEEGLQRGSQLWP